MALKTKTGKARSLMSRISKIEAKIRRLESAQPAVWPFTIVDDEPEADDAKWQELPQEMTIEMLNEGWREEAIRYGLDPDNLGNPTIVGMLKEYVDDDFDSVEAVRDVR